MERVKIYDGTSWPDPTGNGYHDVMWKLINTYGSITRADMLYAASVMESYATLITYPAFTLKIVQKKVSGIRKAIKEVL